MCVCNPSCRTPWCGKPGCEMPEQFKAKPAAFRPSAVYSRVGDLLKVFLEDEPAYAEQLTPQITVLRAFSDKRIVGVKVGDVAPIVHPAGGDP